MNHHTIPIGRIMGIPIGLDYSWFLIFVLLTWSFAVNYYPAEFHDWAAPTYWLTGAATAILLFVSVLIHELGHSVIALRYKIPIRNITLFLFGGVAQMAAEPTSASAEFWISIAGPATSFGLAALFYLFTGFVGAVPPLLGLVKYLAYMNFSLVVFNLLPGFPLDGGRVFRAIVWGLSHNFQKATRIAAGAGRFVAFLFIVLGVWQVFAGNIGNGLWIAFIGWFLDSAASSQVQQQRVQSLLAGHKVSSAMNRRFIEIPANVSVQQLVDKHILTSGGRAFVVKRKNKVAGLLTLHRVREVPRAQWSATRVDQVMIPEAHMKRTRPDAELWECFSAMNRDGVNQLPVMTHGEISGMLTREDIITYIHSLENITA